MWRSMLRINRDEIVTRRCETLPIDLSINNDKRRIQ
jgi:hypothetical protein